MKYTQILLQLTVPYAKKNPSIPEIESGIKKELSKKYKVLDVKILRYDMTTMPDTSGIYYTGNIEIKVKIAGDIDIKKGDKFVLTGNNVIPISGVIIELIALTLTFIAAMIVANKIGAKVLQVYKGYINETIKIIPGLIGIGMVIISILWLVKRK